MLISMVYAFAIPPPRYNWNLEIDHGKIVSIKKNIKFLEKRLVYVYLSLILSLAVTLSEISVEYQKHVFSNDYQKIHLLHI